MRYKKRSLSRMTTARRPQFVSRPDRPSLHRQNVYRAICLYAVDHGGNCPTVREIMERTGVTSTSVVAYNIRALIEMGRLEIKDRKLVVVGGVWTPPPGELEL